MNLLICGLSHKTADLTVREKIAIQKDQVPEILIALLARAEISQAVILSTCNRTEIYTDASSADVIIDVLIKHTEISADELASSLYEYRDLAAVEHVMSVACGLDSMVLGEAQILGQLKEAVALANEYHALDHRFNTLFQRVFTLAKYVRSTTEIGVCPVSIASIAVQLVKNKLTDLSDKTALLIGAGDTTQLTLRYLKQHGLQKFFLASRSLETAQAVALAYGGQGISLSEIKNYLIDTDFVMSATASELPILGKGCVENVLYRRNAKPLLLIDMAVPRDIEPEVANLPQVELFTIDDLKNVANTHVRSREHAAEQARKSVLRHAEEYMQWLASLDSMHVIKAFRDHVSELREQELEKAVHMLKQGLAPEIVLERLANRLTNKLMHIPSVQMRQAGLEGRKEVLQTVRDLFKIEIGDC